MNIHIHTGDAIFCVAGNVKPGAGGHKIRIPALEHLIRVGQTPAKRR